MHARPTARVLHFRRAAGWDEDHARIRSAHRGVNARNASFQKMNKKDVLS
jgi:hypothetical protein